MLWTERFPGRLEYELEDYARRGLDGFALDNSEFDRGRVVVTGTMAVDGEELALRVVYPDLFPYFRPEVFAPGIALGRHQNPFERNLCLLEAATRAWNSSETGAWLVAERVPYLLGLLRAGDDAMKASEAPQGEPLSYYIPRLEGSAVFTTDEMLDLPNGVQGGPAYFSFQNDRIGSALHVLLRQVNGDRRSGGSTVLARAKPELQSRFDGPGIEGRWLRVDAPPGRDPDDYFALCERNGFRMPPWQPAGSDQVAVLGVVFTEEVQQRLWQDSWIFAVRYRTAGGEEGSYLTKGERFDRTDLAARVPRLAGLASRSVALAGLGSLGAPLALELARAQLGALRILDYDLVEGGTTVRWPVGVPAVGTSKTQVIRVSIANQYPYTHCTAVNRHLGVARDVGAELGNDLDCLTEFVSGTDLVVDATAEIAVQQVLADLASEAGIPQIYVWGTEGAYGGAIARVLPGETGCWLCLQYAIEDDSITAPPFEPGGRVQPRGCGQPTFIGEGFNLLPVVAQAARTCALTLLGDLRSGQDVFVMSLRDGKHAAPTPIWTTYALRPHKHCPRCKRL